MDTKSLLTKRTVFGSAAGTTELTSKLTSMSSHETAGAVVGTTMKAVQANDLVHSTEQSDTAVDTPMRRFVTAGSMVVSGRGLVIAEWSVREKWKTYLLIRCTGLTRGFALECGVQ